MPDPTPSAAILSELVRTHKHKFRLFNKYHAVYCVCKKVISKLVLEKYYNSLSSRIIGFAKVTSLQFLTHLITKCVELEDEEVKEINRKMKRHISGEILFEVFVEKIEWNQEAVEV